MELEAIGAIAAAIGLIGWAARPSFAIYAFFVSTLLSSAAALLLPSLGYANIQPAHLLLGFLALATVASHASLSRAGDAMAFSSAGFWLLLTALYASLSAYFLPRIFAGATYVFAVARTEIGPGIISQPLAPVSGNITQSIYFIGDLVCFLVFYVYASRPRELTATVNAALLCAAVNLVFAAIDLGSYWGGMGDVLGFIRNGSYRMLTEGTASGFKRIVGSFPEASTFAYFTVGFFAFCTRLWIAGYRRSITAPLALLSFIALMASTSSTGYAAMCGFLVLLFVSALWQVLTRPVRKETMGLVVALPLVISIALIGVRLSPPAWQAVSDMTDQTVFNKLNTSSGIERQKWNSQALINLADTEGFGGGAGSVRASSFPIAVLGNIGVFGGATYGLFLFCLLFGRRGRWREPFPAAAQSAARWACVAQLIGASVAGSFIDLGLPFFIFAGLACAGPEPARVPRLAPVPALVEAD
jgi:hypothetical protein